MVSPRANERAREGEGEKVGERESGVGGCLTDFFPQGHLVPRNAQTKFRAKVSELESTHQRSFGSSAEVSIFQNDNGASVEVLVGGVGVGDEAVRMILGFRGLATRSI